MRVKKRDGKVEQWDQSKLIRAISLAADDAGEVVEDYDALLVKIRAKANKAGDEISVVDLHSIVEAVLMGSRHKETARKYIEERRDRDAHRERESKLFKDISGFLNQTSEEFLRENANKASSVVTTHRDLLAGIVSKNLAQTQVFPEHVVKAHNDGAIHCHDWDYALSPLTNCCLVNYPDMLENGFKIGDAQISSPKSIGTAATVLTQIAQACASAMYGGQSHCHIDKYLSPYVEKSWQKIVKEQQQWGLPDEWANAKIEKEVYDAMQSFLYQINSLTTTNGQTPFCTISLGLDTSRWGRLITKQYLAVHEEGIGEDKVTPVFPKVIFFLDDDINLSHGTPNYDLKQLAVRCSAKRMYPDYVYTKRNREITGVKGEPVTCMGCRSFLSAYEQDGNEVLFGRFNLGVVSINLPYVALEANGDEDAFYRLLNKHCLIAKDAHLTRVNRLKGTKAKQNPVLWVHGVLARLDPEDTIDSLFYGGYSSISLGYVGLTEALEILYGSMDKEKGLGILKWMKDLCETWKSETGLGFSLYGTPSESFCHKAAKAVRTSFGKEHMERDYVTNSFHFPVWNKVHVQDKWGYEKGFDELSSGGNIVYVEMPNLQRNLQAYEGLLDYACHIGLHYFAINTPVDRCFVCGYEGEFTPSKDGFSCPCCSNSNPDTVSVVRRVSGYISSPNARPYNQGKQQEVIEREKHMP